MVTTRTALGYTLTSGFVLGAMIGYLNSSQQIFQELYALGPLFPLYFAVVSSAVGVASILNSRLVMRFGMRMLVRSALVIILLLSSIALVAALATAGQPPFWFLMIYLMGAFFCIGILFGNMNALAMEPLGHIAGIGAAVVGALSTLLSTLLGTVVGQSYDGTILPLVAGMVILTTFSLAAVFWAEAGQVRPPG